MGMTTISEIRDFSKAVTDVGLDEWQHIVRGVAPSRHVELWSMANRLRAIAIEALAGGSRHQRERVLEHELAQSQQETAHLLKELEARVAQIAALEATVAELGVVRTSLPTGYCTFVHFLMSLWAPYFDVHFAFLVVYIMACVPLLLGV
ncbi:uncharacterized protein LOC141649025 [Silene latifolia]|uniref:uncharacterized protein LOC141649025 n=1 Tax=Silene latifolia TaxID=37657 RepID=UPI003D78212E